MLEIPFDIISCSWPRPVEQADGRWISEPEWNAPLMPYWPQLRWESIHGERCWMVNWREMFKEGIKTWDSNIGGEMREFHIVFRLKAKGDGKLIFWDDDGCVIRRNGQIVHEDRSAHMLSRNEIEVEAGDILEVAHWQLHGGWLWGARLDQPDGISINSVDVLMGYLGSIKELLRHSNGPPLKMYTNGAAAVRAVVSLYSMILNGYAPSQIILFGENQWSEKTKSLFNETLSFAEVVPTGEVISRVQSVGGAQVSEMARRWWFVMKTCIALLYPPDEFCLMDDDVFILDTVADAIRAFKDADLVFAPDFDHCGTYKRVWNRERRELDLATGRFNAGLYWLRTFDDPRRVAARMRTVYPGSTHAFIWEQGFIATLYSERRTFELPKQRYFYPIIDGLPGGPLGYDYRLNPCGFASIHFGGLGEKPSDEIAFQLAPHILDRFR